MFDSSRRIFGPCCWFASAGHSQSLVPHLTEPYGAVAASAAEAAAVPVCSVRGSPTAPLHAVHWASAILEQVFETDLAAAYRLLLQLLQQPALPAATVLKAEGHQRPFTMAVRSISAAAAKEAAGPPANGLDTLHDGVQETLRILRNTPAAVEAVASGAAHLQRLLLLAYQIVQAQLEAQSERKPHQQQRQKQQQRQNQAFGVVPSLSATHLRMVGWGLSLFRALFETAEQTLQRRQPKQQHQHLRNELSEGDIEAPTVKRPIPLDFTDTDVLDFVGSAAQLLASSLELEPEVAAATATDSTDAAPNAAAAAAVLERQKAEELLLQGRGEGPWSRESVAAALQQLMQKSSGRHADDTVAFSDAAAPGEGSRAGPYAAALALQQKLASAATVASSAAAEGLERQFLKAPVVPPLSPDGAVPLRFLTAAARLRCRSFGLLPLPNPQETQQLLGRIVPATATATTLAAAFACLEVYRLAALGLVGKTTAQEQHHKQQKQQQRRATPRLWLDRGLPGHRRALLRQQQQLLRNSFFSLSVPFIAEAPPLPPQTFRFLRGRWRGQQFSRWALFRLRIHGAARSCSSSKPGVVPGSDVPGELEAAETLSVLQLAQLIEKETGVKVLALSTEESLLYVAPKAGNSPQRQQQPDALPPGIAELFGNKQKQQQFCNPQLPLAEVLRRYLVGQNPTSDHRRWLRGVKWIRWKQQQQQQEGRRLTWVVVSIEAADASGEAAPLPPLKVLVSA